MSVLSRLRPYGPTAAFLFLIAYFAVSALTGERGLLGDRKRDAALAARTAELTRLQAERSELERRVRLLDDRALSADMLDERARILLGFADPRDYVIRLKP